MNYGDALIYLALLLSVGALPGHALALISVRRNEAARSARNLATGLMLLSLMLTIAVWALLTYYFVTSDMNIQYVHSHSSTDLDGPYKISALWAGKEGSFLLWVMGMQVGLIAARLLFTGSKATKGRAGRRLLDICGLVGGVLVILFLAILATMDPFRATSKSDLLLNPDGTGLNNLLQHPLMAIHPMLALLGYGFATVTFVSSVGFLLTGNKHWAVYSLPFSRLFFIIFSAALVIGGLWAYETLGWGGYWGWDPVETSSLLPWLMAAVVCHAQVSYIKRRESLLLGATASFFLLPVILFATFAARSGLWESVHAYAAVKGDFWEVVGASGFLKGMLGLIVLLCVLGPLMLARAYLQYYEEGPKQKEPPLSRYFSKRSNAMLLGSALTLMGTLVTIFIMVMRLGGPLDPSELEIKLGPIALFMVAGMMLYHLGTRWSMPLLPFVVLAIGVVMGLVSATLFPEQPLGAFSIPFLVVAIACSIQHLWRSPKAGQRRQRLHDAGASLIHIGIILLLLGYSGSTFFSSERTLNLSEDTKVGFEDYELVIVDHNFTGDHAYVSIEVRRDGAVQGVARPGISIVGGQPRSEVSIVRLLDKDLYFVIEDVQKMVETGSGVRAQVKVKSLPAINALWAGSVLVMTGSAIRFAWTPTPNVSTVAKGQRRRSEEE